MPNTPYIWYSVRQRYGVRRSYSSPILYRVEHEGSDYRIQSQGYGYRDDFDTWRDLYLTQLRAVGKQNLPLIYGRGVPEAKTGWVTVRNWLGER